MQALTLRDVYQAGLDDEQRVLDFIAAKFPNHKVKPSTRDENIFQDIDLWVGATAVSVKAQHSGASFGNICFELLQSPRVLKDEVTSQRILNASEVHPDDLETLIGVGWIQSWYYTSKASIYAILQGTTLRLYHKSDIIDYVEDKGNGFLRIKQLTKARRSYLLNSNYRYTNSLCGYLNIDDVPHCRLKM